MVNVCPAMKKNVQFSSTNIMYSPISWSSSLPPSPEPAESPLPAESILEEKPPLAGEDTQAETRVSPAPIIYSPWPAPSRLGMSPVRKSFPDLPPIAATQIHFLLSFMPFTPPNVHYDLVHPLHTLNSQLTPSFLDPATFPHIPALYVLCQHIAWPILVSASQPGGFVSVLDVVTSVYTSLRVAVRRAEYDALPSGDARQRVDKAYFARCRSVADEHERQIETLKGVKRVDFLTGRTRFMGLSGPLGTPSVWELNVS
ncbi:hypothetical protein B0H11DRAFT_1954639 [Mycena galericulata]|nr:hypothetical protein B0H11DRAFT_1954639 [Mycena galericulata]